ncbi:MAG: hypothetical protein ACI8XG_000168 [Congregibacter sp.]|jgi:hypothetical protein
MLTKRLATNIPPVKRKFASTVEEKLDTKVSIKCNFFVNTC